MNYTIIKTSELPRVIREAVQAKYNLREVKVTACEKCHVGTSWHDANRTDVTVIDLSTDKIQTVDGRYYDSYVNMSTHERALYRGIDIPIQHKDLWVIEFNSYPKSAHIYCHPDNISKLLPADLPLTLHQKVVLNITRSLISSARLEEARRFGISRAKWLTTVSQLIAIGLMSKNGALNTKGKNEAAKYNYNYFDKEVINELHSESNQDEAYSG